MLFITYQYTINYTYTIPNLAINGSNFDLVNNQEI